jgi:hypothetical protein
MQRPLNAVVSYITFASLVALPAGLSAASAWTTPAAWNTRVVSAATSAATPDVIRDRIDAADDMLDDMLDIEPVITNYPGSGVVRPSNTLMNVDAQSIETLRGVLESIVADLPARNDRSGSEARGDLRAHAEKAVEIAVELGPLGGTSGTTATADNAAATATHGCTVTVNRTALERLQVEVNAMTLLEPQS